MAYLLKKLSVKSLFLLGFASLLFTLNACNKSTPGEVNKVQPIKDAEIIAFQKAYGISFNAISKAIEDKGYYESAARKHIDQHYNFKEGKVMFKIGNNEDAPFRYTYDGLLSYLIGKNKDFPKDEGIANQNWRKIDWNNSGIIKEGNIAIAIGTVKMINEDNDEINQNYTMGLKRDSQGDIKLIVHKISRPCE
ncbi:MAG: hypothetical protein AAFZ15_21170 [Bacteroidota bacterium]